MDASPLRFGFYGIGRTIRCGSPPGRFSAKRLISWPHSQFVRYHPSGELPAKSDFGRFTSARKNTRASEPARAVWSAVRRQKNLGDTYRVPLSPPYLPFRTFMA